MSRVKIQIYHENNARGDTNLIRTIWIETESTKQLMGKRAGQILANNFPEFDNNSTRNGLIKTDKGWRASRTFKPTEKCNYHFIWEVAVVTEENSD